MWWFLYSFILNLRTCASALRCYALLYSRSSSIIYFLAAGVFRVFGYYCVCCQYSWNGLCAFWPTGCLKCCLGLDLVLVFDLRIFLIIVISSKSVRDEHYSSSSLNENFHSLKVICKGVCLFWKKSHRNAFGKSRLINAYLKVDHCEL